MFIDVQKPIYVGDMQKMRFLKRFTATDLPFSGPKIVPGTEKNACFDAFYGDLPFLDPKNVMQNKKRAFSEAFY